MFFGWAVQLSALAVERSDILLDIVSHCLDPAPANYCNLCRAPRTDAKCSVARECKQTTEVWELNDRFTALRDIKMCGCPSDFVHGLALPIYRVTGVEDPLRPEGIWQFAWDVAIKRMKPESIALVVNPRLHRSQNQLHVHLLRLKADALDKLKKEAADHVSDLDQVWASASRSAAAQGLDDYGVLVVQNPPKGFTVVVTADSPETAWTEWRCD